MTEFFNLALGESKGGEIETILRAQFTQTFGEAPPDHFELIRDNEQLYIEIEATREDIHRYLEFCPRAVFYDSDGNEMEAPPPAHDDLRQAM